LTKNTQTRNNTGMITF